MLGCANARSEVRTYEDHREEESRGKDQKQEVHDVNSLSNGTPLCRSAHSQEPPHSNKMKPSSDCQQQHACLAGTAGRCLLH